jgi:small nuclear ribonucleoprotein (snRNP)-like protein
MSELSLLHSQFLHLAQWIKLKLDNGEEIEGQIFTYDKISNVVLQQKCKN